MDFIIKLLHTLFFVALFIVFYIKYNKAYFVKSHYFIILILSLVVLFYLDTIYTTIPNKLLFILILFSLSIPILNVIKNFINIKNHSLLKQDNIIKDNYVNMKNLLFTKIIPIMILCYQLLLIWIPIIYKNMSKK